MRTANGYRFLFGVTEKNVLETDNGYCCTTLLIHTHTHTHTHTNTGAYFLKG